VIAAQAVIDKDRSQKWTMDHGTKKFIAAQEKSAKDALAEANQVVAAYQSGLEAKFGYPVVYTTLGRNGAGGTVRSVWDQPTACQHHSIDLAPSDEWLQPCARAHELTHIELECRANASGVRRTHFARVRLGQSPTPGLEFEEYKFLFSYAANVPVDMVVDSLVFERWPVLRPSMFLRAFRFQNSEAQKKLSVLSCSPRFFESVRALRAVSALFTDRLHGASTSFFRPHRHFPEGKMAENLYEAFASCRPWDAADVHYKLTDRFAEILGLANLHQWDPRPRYETMN
jgi:hypothetical protein